ncbi:MAG: class I SAM-dependent methyltransferase [Bacteroidia bacterium]|nr:class I SAM-dependent methyltransferase [Bacteroidia bacterium]
MLRKIYHWLHDKINDTIEWNPLFPKTFNGKPVKKGHISEEHLKSTALDDALSILLTAAGIVVKDYEINPYYYQYYLKKACYPLTYYGGGMDPNQNFTQKTLEHFVSLDFLNLQTTSVFIDIAACTSPFAEIVSKIYSVKQTYQQDLVYPKGVHGKKIGGFAHEIPFSENSVDAITLHCSLEHFEGESDILFFQTMNRILKPGGRLVILPLYIAHEYTIHIDPAFNLLRCHLPKLNDKRATLRYCNWYQYYSRHYDVLAIQERMLKVAPSLSLTIYRVRNFRVLDSQGYLRFIGVFEKKMKN